MNIPSFVSDPPAADHLEAAPSTASNYAFPLSYGQQRLWFIQQLAPYSTNYNVPIALRFVGRLNVPALEASLNEVVRRHDALRTTFPERNGEPVQLISAPAPLRLAMTDLSEVAAAHRDQGARRMRQTEAGQHFDLAQGPLLRARLVRLDDSCHELLLTLHHIISDGWSRGILIDELLALYEAYRLENTSPLAEPDLQYPDYAVWQRYSLGHESLTRQLEYWRKQLADLPVLELASDHPKPQTAEHPAGSFGFSLSAELTAGLKELARAESATTFVVLLAAFQWLLSTYTGQEDVAVGTAFANRDRRETEGVVGFFVNTVVLRTNAGGAPTFRQLIKRALDVTIEAHSNKDVPFEQVVEQLRPDRTLGASPFFRVMFSVENSSAACRSLPDLEIEEISDVDLKQSKFELMMILRAGGERLTGELEFASDMYSLPSMERLIRRYKMLLQRAVSEPDKPLTEISLLEEDERQQILYDWNRTDTSFPADQAAHRVFEDQARRNPHAPAVIHGATRLTYEELNGRASQLARALLQSGAAVETRVGLCMQRGPQMICAVLAVLKAGGVCVPLDPGYPAERISFIVEDAGVEIVLVEKKYEAIIPNGKYEVICLDSTGGDVDSQSKADLRHTVTGENLAYVMYTSGSTGVPKGVAIPHRAISRLVLNSDYVQLNASDRVAQVANPSFDAIIFEVWGALLNGGSTVIIDHDLVLSPAELSRAFRRERITAAFLTTALFNQVVRESQGVFQGMRYLLFGGEQADPRSVASVSADTGPTHLLHVYGPTESTTFSTWFEIDRQNPEVRMPPIGRPIANGSIHILDKDMRPVPIGIPGEIYVGGAGLARGYWRRPGVTAEKFVPDPFNLRPGSRLYRTGDMGRYNADGCVEFFGRVDFQVKVRGFRIELGELESHLLQLPSVKEAVVIVRGEGAEKRILGYVTLEDGISLTAGEIRNWLREKLPEYARPAAITILPSLPLTSNGKVDRRALPEPERDTFDDSVYVAPIGVTEEILCRMWCELLNLERVSTHDDFFDLGGHSLLITRLASRLRSDLGIELPLRTLFERPTVALLAESVRERQDTCAYPEIPRADRNADMPLSPAQRRLWFLQQLQSQSSAYNVPFFLRLTGELNCAALSYAISEIVRRHEVLRTAFPARSGQPVQEICQAAPVQVPLVDLSGLDSPDRERVAESLRKEEAGRLFDLSCGPLLRVTLLRLSGQEHELLLTFHHIVADGWSQGILARELREFYGAYCEGRPSPIAALDTQYADYAAWQQKWLQADELEKQLDYWRKQLEGVPVLDVPTDYPRAQNLSHPRATRLVRITPELTSRLRTLAKQENATLFMALAAGFQSLLVRYSREKDVAVGTVIANRRRREIEPLVGFFVNTLVLRTDFRGAPSFRDALRRVRETTLDAYAHQDVPFEKLIEELNPDRDLGRTPVFQTMIVLQNASPGVWHLPGIQVKEIDVSLEETKFEFTLSLFESDSSLQGQLDYASDLFDETTIEQLLRHYVRLLDLGTAEPERSMGDLPLLEEQERRHEVEEWNQTAKTTPLQCALDLFEAQAERRPDAAAVVYEGSQVSYRELNQQANRLARYLRMAGVGREVKVGVFLERNAGLMAAMLAVWKAGGVYVPLDPNYPRERLAFMVEDAELSLVLTDETLSEELPPCQARLVCVDAEWEQIEGQDGDNPERNTQGSDLAYVMYTSGSTGKPKGAMVEQRGMMNHLWAKVEDLGLGEGDAVAQNAPASFDISVWQMMAALLVGGQVQIFGEESARDAFELLKEVDRLGVTVVETVPTLLGIMIEQQSRRQGQGVKLKRLRWMISNAEALPTGMANQWAELYPAVPLLNTYGATECSDDTSHRLVSSTTGENRPYVTLGRPIANMTTYVLDESMQIAPGGVTGELYIGGVGVGRGYLKRPALTAERFIPDPFSAFPGARLYRTGDLGRRHRDGHLEFAGRDDHQLKIRGHRVELGEIEEVLSEHPDLAQALVIATDARDAEKRLVGYVIPKSGRPEDVELGERLHKFMSDRLPEYMVPAAFVCMGAFPLTANGKVDRRVLPAVGLKLGNEESYVAPRTELETMLCGLWAQLLQVARVGVHDNFFALGGHSLLATQLVSRIHNTLSLEIPLVAAFRSPTVAGFAVEIERAGAGQGRTGVAPIVAADRSAFRSQRSASSGAR